MRLLFISLLLSMLAGNATASNTPNPAPAKKILVFGDSLSAGYGIDQQQSWPSLLSKKITARGLPYVIINASISGETTAGGLARFPQALREHKPALVIIALGANDGLRGLPLPAMRENLLAMVRAAQKAKARILLVGMKLPPNYGLDYTARFASTFTDIAAQEKIPCLPFLLEPIADQRNAFQPDGLHPLAQAQPKLLDHVWAALYPLVKK